MFSVLIPVYNHARYLTAAVRSALVAPLASEILLVDDGSRDESARLCALLAAAHPGRVRDLTSNDGNKGAHVRLNQLCAAASSPWLAVLNSDDEFSPGRLEAMRAVARKSRAGLVAGGIVIIDHDGQCLGLKQGIANPEYPLPDILRQQIGDRCDTIWMRRALCNQNFVATTSNFVVSKALFEKVGGFADLRYSHDWEFLLRASVLGEVAFTSYPCTRYRSHPTNTIKEQSGQVDGEILRFFDVLLQQFSEIEQDDLCREALAGNRHLPRYVPPEQIWATPAKSTRSPEGRGVKADMLAGIDDISLHAADAVRLTAAHYDYDFLIVSEELSELPSIGTANFSNAVVAPLDIRQALIAGNPLSLPLRGRVIRALPSGSDVQSQELTALDAFADARFVGAEIVLHDAPQVSRAAVVRAASLPSSLTLHEGRPRILVLSIFLAVGGAERNMIEVLKALSTRFDFLVVSSERLLQHQGSLHYQLAAAGISWIDLAEIGNREDHLSLLTSITLSFRPDAVWICNGSPWLLHNYAALRRLFYNTAIVDQQVYDVQHGWVNDYANPAVQSADRFVAGTRRIYQHFTEKLRMPPSRIDVIYHAIQVDTIAAVDNVKRKRSELRQALAIPSDVRCFAFVGRLTSQKQPLVFLELARHAQEEGRSDHFLLLGDGELRPQCDAFVAAMGLKNVTTMPYIADMREVAGIADGLIMTSAYEGLSIALLQMLAMGRAVLSTDVGDTAAIVNDYGSGAIVPSDDAPAVWAAFQGWAANLEHYQEKAEAAREQVMHRFSAATIAEQYASSWMRAIDEHAQLARA